MQKKHLNLISGILIALAIIASLFLVGQRINIEEDYKQVEIMANYTELISLARANNIELGELTSLFKAGGLTGVLVKELSIGDLERSGDLQLRQGGQIALTPYAEFINKEIPLEANHILIAIHNKALEEQILKHLEIKIPGISYYPAEVSVLVIPVNLPNSEAEKAKIIKKIQDLGVGFNLEELKDLTDQGLSIIPQIRTWNKPTHKSLVFVAEEIKKIPNVSILLFNDDEIPGYPKDFKALADELWIDGQIFAPIGVVEFFNQKGINNIAAYLNKETVRIHSISYDEMGLYKPQTALDRFELAIRERNIRGLFVRFFEMDQPAHALEANLNFWQDLKSRIEGAGFTIAAPVQQYQSPTYSVLFMLVIGLGVIAGGVLLASKKDWILLGTLVLVLGIVIWSGLLYLSPILARKMMALASVIIFPTLAFLVVTKEEARTIGQSIIALLKISFISWIGALLMIGLLADKLFMLKLDQFVGVKLAHALPLFLVLALIYKFGENPVEEIKDILNQPITYLIAALGGIIVLGFGFYILRTGNVDSNLVLGIEQQMRDLLNNILGIRPRTKEFLIGHPATILLFYFGLSKKNWPLLIPAVIGQVSLVNTYAHIHTPIVVSLIRSFHGLWIGVVGGIVLIFIVKWSLRRAW